MTVKEKLVATLPPLGFIVDGHTEEFDFCCEDVNGYDCLLTLELHPNFLYAVAFVFPSPQSPDSVEFDIEFPLTVTVDDYVNLPTGFLYAGARCVISTLWAINDLSGSLVMAKFHELWDA